MKCPFKPCIGTKAARVPDRHECIDEIKHDGYRLIIQRDGRRERTRNSHDWTDQFPLITEAALRNRCTLFNTVPVRAAFGEFESSVLKPRHGLQFVLGGVIHHVIGIPTATGGGC